MNEVPIRFHWDGEVMKPASPLWARKADERFVVGMEYPLEEIHQRSNQTHRHYFAVVKEAWQSLPDHLAARFETAEHLRKYALIKARFFDKRSIHCASVLEARKVAAFIRPMDSYAIVTTEGSVVTIWTAQSQDHRHMDKATFQRSKQGVLEVIGDLLGVDPATLSRVQESA